MTIALPKHHEDLLRAEVDAGRFKSIDEALAFALEHFLPGATDDLGWAKPAVDEARAEMSEGPHRSIAEYRATLKARIAGLDPQ